MRAVIQRVKQAEVKVGGRTVGAIGAGLLILLAVHRNDLPPVVAKMGEKILNLRIFSDEEGKMNRSLRQAGREILLVSQFTLYGDARKGNRPSFVESAEPQKAKEYYQQLAEYLRSQDFRVETGEFGAQMEVALINDGPVTIILDI
ncbi:D-tyrosyl-tRNA(Tyr) deacylase [Candidatus Parcubacteria bacterium]|nr:MAG: D-tyrosyl-tRNA(Tyr) deacylase [Candidatus Parcubacteria bacterium]